MKKQLIRKAALLLAAAMLPAMLSSCVSNDKVKLGTLVMPDEESASIREMSRKAAGGRTNVEHVGLNSYNELVLALDSGKVDIISVPSCIAYEITRQKSGYSLIKFNTVRSFQMAFLPEKAELRDKVNAAISEMISDGSLDALFNEYMVNDPSDSEKKKDVAKIEGAETIKIAVTGDMPPLDYISADGTPMGFSVAVMSAVSEKIGLNVEFVSVATEARVASLSSGKADAVFWYMSAGEDGAADNDKLIFSTPYYESNSAAVAKSDKIDAVIEKAGWGAAETVPAAMAASIFA